MSEPLEPIRCSKCDKLHKGCVGHRKGDGEPCEAPALVRGTRNCRIHLGRTSREVIAEAEASKALRTFGEPVKGITAVQALVERIEITVGQVRWLESVISELQPEALVWDVSHAETGTRKGWQSGSHATVSRTAAPSVWIDLYEKASKRLLDYVKVALANQIAERQMAEIETRGALLAETIRKCFGDDELALSPEQQDAARRVVARHLRLLGDEEAA